MSDFNSEAQRMLRDAGRAKIADRVVDEILAADSVQAATPPLKRRTRT